MSAYQISECNPNLDGVEYRWSAADPNVVRVKLEAVIVLDGPHQRSANCIEQMSACRDFIRDRLKIERGSGS